MKFNLDVIEKNGEKLFEQMDDRGNSILFDNMPVAFIAMYFNNITITHNNKTSENTKHINDPDYKLPCITSEFDSTTWDNQTELKAGDLNIGDHVDIKNDKDDKSANTFLADKYKKLSSERVWELYKEKMGEANFDKFLDTNKGAEEYDNAVLKEENSSLPEVLRF